MVAVNDEPWPIVKRGHMVKRQDGSLGDIVYDKPNPGTVEVEIREVKQK